jgi:hypothetical protein
MENEDNTQELNHYTNRQLFQARASFTLHSKEAGFTT